MALKDKKLVKKIRGGIKMEESYLKVSYHSVLDEETKFVEFYPNDDVNKSQSSNDTYPTAMHLAFVLKVEDEVLPAIRTLKDSIKEKAEAYKDLVKIGRTHNIGRNHRLY